MLKGGLLAWLLWQGGVVVDESITGATSVSGSTGEEEGEETVNTGQTSITKKYNKAKRGARGDLTQY